VGRRREGRRINGRQFSDSRKIWTNQLPKDHLANKKKRRKGERRSLTNPGNMTQWRRLGGGCKPPKGELQTHWPKFSRRLTWTGISR